MAGVGGTGVTATAIGPNPDAATQHTRRTDVAGIADRNITEFRAPSIPIATNNAEALIWLLEVVLTRVP